MAVENIFARHSKPGRCRGHGRGKRISRDLGACSLTVQVQWAVIVGRRLVMVGQSIEAPCHGARPIGRREPPGAACRRCPSGVRTAQIIRRIVAAALSEGRRVSVCRTKTGNLTNEGTEVALVLPLICPVPRVRRA